MSRTVVGALVAVGFVLAAEAMQAQEMKPAFLRITVPADAKVEIQGHATTQTGEVRRYQSPPIAVGRNHVYTIKVTYKDGSSQTKEVTVRAGEETAVDLRSAAASPQQPKPPEKLREPDVIFVPTPQKVVDKMLEMAKVTKDDILYDLGCGDGRIPVTAAKKYGCKAWGFDIDPARIKDSNENVAKNKVGHLVTIEQKDIFTLDLSKADVVTLYLLPRLNVKLLPQLKKMKPGSRIVSHDFDIEGYKPAQTVEMLDEDGIEHTVYLWVIGKDIPADKPGDAAQKPEEKDRRPDVIYVPTPQPVVEKMLEVAQIKKGDYLLDLGCGDCRIPVTAAKKYGIKAKGYDIDPDRIKDSLENIEKNNVKELVTVEKKDIFTLDLSEATVISLYLLPSLNVKLVPQLNKMKPGSRIVTHDFDIRGYKHDKLIRWTPPEGGREHLIYLYTIPLKPEKE